ncbi:unnamed protein product [Chrysoparadoxa australica]
MGRKGQAKKSGEQLGKSLIKQQVKHQAQRREAARYDVDGSQARGKMVSILESNNLDDFIASAVMAEREFESHKADTILLNPMGETINIDSNGNKVQYGNELAPFNFEHMMVPRRPPWDESMTAEELDRVEKLSFLEWRRNIAAQEEQREDLKVTPFEKNLEVWRQLWRVLERSDIILQIVDARNPLFYFSRDLMDYAASLTPPRPMVILINKSDYLSIEQRRLWAAYFKEQGLPCLFFSAAQEQDRVNAEAREEKSGIDLNAEEDDDDDEEEEDEEAGTDRVLPKNAWGVEQVLIHSGETRESSEYKLLGRVELMTIVEGMARRMCSEDVRVKNQGRACVGMVGYPNVGKSSVINVLANVAATSHGVVRVGVGATPGKTKHFQTLVLSDTFMLCDCPGLVFPSFVSSTEEMICAGVLPIMHMRDAMAPMRLIARYIPRHVLQVTYTIKIAGTVQHNQIDAAPSSSCTAEALLDAYCKSRGFFGGAAKGSVDVQRGSRSLLKDFTTGKLLHCHPPPGLSDEELKRFLQETIDTSLKRTKLALKIAAKQKKLGLGQEGQETDEFLKRIGDVEQEQMDQREKKEASSEPTRAERGIKKWGKKSKKVKNQIGLNTPYEESDMLAKQRSVGAMVAGGKKKGKNAIQRGGFVRATLPHHPTYSVAKTEQQSQEQG